MVIKNDNRVNRNKIICATSTDYTPYVEGYGHYFEPIAKVKFDEEYLKSDEYCNRKSNYEQNESIFLNNDIRSLIEADLSSFPEGEVKNSIRNAISKW